MEQKQKNKLLQQIIWDYNIPVAEIEAVLKGEKSLAGHYTREMLFQKIIESYSWFTILELFSPEEIKTLLNNDVIQKLHSPALRKKHEFIQKRLQQIIPVTG